MRNNAAQFEPTLSSPNPNRQSEDRTEYAESPEVIQAQTALFTAIILDGSQTNITSSDEKALSFEISQAIHDWQRLQDSEKAKVWKASQNRTAKHRSIHPVLEQLQIMAGIRPAAATGEMVHLVIPESVYQLASDTFLLMLYRQEKDSIT